MNIFLDVAVIISISLGIIAVFCMVGFLVWGLIKFIQGEFD